MNQSRSSQPIDVVVLRWFARIAGSVFVLLFVWLFIEDNSPFHLFASDPVHMAALSIALLGLLVGWKSDRWAAGMILFATLAEWIIVSIRSGELVLYLGPLVTFFPIIGLMYLYCQVTLHFACAETYPVSGGRSGC